MSDGTADAASSSDPELGELGDPCTADADCELGLVCAGEGDHAACELACVDASDCQALAPTVACCITPGGRRACLEIGEFMPPGCK